MNGTSFKVGEDVLVYYGILPLLHKANVERVRKHHIKVTFYNPVKTKNGDISGDWIR